MEAFMTRTRDEIAAAVSGCGFLDFRADVWLSYLDFDRAKPYLRPEVTREQWEAPEGGKAVPLDPADRDHILRSMRAYAEFGWEKVRDHRSISASRTADKMCAWAWLLGDDEAVAARDTMDWAQYGAPFLAYVCERFGLPIPEGEDIARMRRGEPCEDGCSSGCGR